MGRGGWWSWRRRMDIGKRVMRTQERTDNIIHYSGDGRSMQRRLMKVCLLGEGAVGKTSLIRKYVYDAFDDEYIKSIGAKVTKKRLEIPESNTMLTLMISDILGQMSNEDLHTSYLHGLRGAILVCDLTRRDTFKALERWIRIVHRVAEAPPMVIMGNKHDLTDKIEVKEAELAMLARKLGGVYFLASAKTGENVEKAFDLLGRKMVAGSAPVEGWSATPAPRPAGQTPKPAPPVEKRAAKEEPTPKTAVKEEPTPERAVKEEETASGEPIKEGDMKRDIPQDTGERACPECGSHDIKLFPDGSGMCEDCEAVVPKPVVSAAAAQLGSAVEIGGKSGGGTIEESVDKAEKKDTLPPESGKVTEETSPPSKKPVPMEKTRSGEKTDIPEESAPFFNVPVDALHQLKERLEIVLANRGEDTVHALLGEYGYDCGCTAIKSMGITCTMAELKKMLPDLWIGIGLS
ncbi:MAG: GTP-binding protein, partial [Thermoplasmata archaeon]|nr:GTP-binding protein [Thermoplasmata archaeon]